ncbi:MAG: restriction endonuclease subunit S [Gammaproteobacteria bacterium]|nr:restriction endonuclease subunit S [Gammaproteobacteria bacterium]MCF6260390.1 restriction endonuclease subunit S [Gammaproteobacteria bacterium]
MVPEGWQMEMLKNIVDGGIKNGYSPNAAEKNTGHWVLGLGALGDNGLIASEIKPVEATQKVLNCRLHPGDFLISRSNTPDKVGRSILFKGEINNCSYPDLMMRFRVNESLVDAGFIAAKLKSSFIRGYFKNCAAGSSRTMVKINKPIVEKTPILLPPLHEQKKIARILSSWDKAIETVENLIKNSKAQKKALMQQLLTGKRRLPKFEKEWKNTPLEKLIVESRIPGTTGDVAQKITIKLYGQGVVPKNEKRQGSQSTKYYKRKAGQFIYSKLDFLNGAFGIIPKKLDGFESTLDLPAFDFKTGVEPVWFINFVSREAFYSANLSLANGGRKARRVNPKDLLNLKISLPSYPEQQKIAALLTTADKETTTLQQKLDCLKQEKKALMQQLLTGKRRVKVDG